jgi:hypoxia induced protein
MDLLGLLLLLAAACVVLSLVFGLSSMATDGDVGHRTSAQWMNWRVAFQAVAFVLILLAMLSRH